MNAADPVLARREQVRTLVRIGKSVGYALLLVAIAVFVIARIDGPRSVYTTVMAWSMAICTLCLAPAIVFGYAIRAAEREDRQRAAAAAQKATGQPAPGRGSSH